MSSQSLAVREAAQIANQRDEWDSEKRALLARTIAKGATSDELELFIAVCRRTGLDPFAKQIYAIKRRDQLSIQIGIDGYRLVAERTGKYGGQLGPQYLDADGAWIDYWVEKTPPRAARVGVVRKDWSAPIWAVARWQSYAQQTPLWTSMPEVMLAKCAEGLAMRKAFPMELAGYRQVAPEVEMPEVDQADEPDPGPSPKARAIVAEMDATIAEADALLEQPLLVETDGEITSDLWEEVKVLATRLDQAGVKFMLPPATQTTEFHRLWIERMTRALRAKTS